MKTRVDTTVQSSAEEVRCEVSRDPSTTYIFVVTTGNCPSCKNPTWEHIEVSVYSHDSESPVVGYCSCGAVYQGTTVLKHGEFNPTPQSPLVSYDGRCPVCNAFPTTLVEGRFACCSRCDTTFEVEP